MKNITARQFALLEKLCNACAVSGDEGEVRRIVLEEVQPLADEVRVDAMGNVLAIKNGTGKNRPRVMLDAHMDEIGFMLVAEDGEGLYQFVAVGGIDPRILPGKPVWVGKDHTPGVIGIKPIHLVSGMDEVKGKPSIESLRIDLGPGGKASPGDWATFATKFKRVGASIFAKAIDDRIGVATLIELLRNAPPNIDLLAAFTVQEEIGLRGAKIAAHALAPDLAIAVDSTPAYDMPKHDKSENTKYNTKLGLGPAIYVHNAATLDDPRLVRFLRETAAAAHIPYQIRQPGGGGTNAGAIQRAREGVPVVSVSVPGRYAHTPIGLCRVDDWKHTLALLQAALERITPDLLK
ncbi:MAG: M42 family metallopeptidase [Anaerolineales bacterium]